MKMGIGISLTRQNLLGVSVPAPVEGFAVEGTGEEPVITVAAGNVTVTINSGTYAGTYTTDVDGATLTVANVEAAPVAIVRPVVSGTTAEGDTLTITRGLWLYDGPDLGDQTWQAERDNVAISGATALTYVIVSADLGTDFTVVESYGGQTVESVATSIPGVTVPAQMAAPSLVVDSATQITATKAADPGDGGSAITSYDLRYSTDQATWTESIGFTSPLAVTGLTASTLYYIQTRAVNGVGAGAWSASASATTDAAPSFVPTDLADLFAWYDFTDTSSLYTDAARTTNVATDGDLVRGVLDKSGNGWHMGNASGGNTWDATNGQVQVSGAETATRYTTDASPTGLPATLEFYAGLKTSDSQFIFFYVTASGFFGVLDGSGSSADQGFGNPVYSADGVDIGDTRVDLLNDWSTGAGVVAGVRDVDASGLPGHLWKFFSYTSGFAYDGDVTHIVVTEPLTVSERSDLQTYLQARTPV